MSKAKTLIFLVNSMTRSEKKAFRLGQKRTQSIPGYLLLYNLIESSKEMEVEAIKAQYLSERKGGSFEVSVKYLYKMLIDVILKLKKEEDSVHAQLNEILTAKVLFEKALFQESLSLLKRVMKEAKKLGNHNVLLLASRLEIEYLHALNFPSYDEKMLLDKHLQISHTLRRIMKVNEQSSIYDLLMHRKLNQGNIRSSEEKAALNDLLVSEISIMSSPMSDDFEMNKIHQLFQANYMISVGDFKSAFRSFDELNLLFENNKAQWKNPPLYYLQTLEGVLDSLRGIRNYKGMSYFVEQLRKLESSSVNFNANVDSLIFLYTLFPSLDQGEFIKSKDLLESHLATIYSKLNLVSMVRKAELCLYAALVYFSNREFRKAYGYLKYIFFEGREFQYLPLYRTIRIANLMILYELADYDLIKYETRSIRSNLRKADEGYLIEKVILRFINTRLADLSRVRRQAFEEDILQKIDVLRADVYESQVLKIFDFTAWLESKIQKEKLSVLFQVK